VDRDYERGVAEEEEGCEIVRGIQSRVLIRDIKPQPSDRTFAGRYIGFYLSDACLRNTGWDVCVCRESSIRLRPDMYSDPLTRCRPASPFCEGHKRGSRDFPPGVRQLKEIGGFFRKDGGTQPLRAANM
jgi:hypothetical protein